MIKKKHFGMIKKNLSWKKAKKLNPHLNPFSDADKDGVRNYLDCRPFDKTKQDRTHKHIMSSIREKVPVSRFKEWEEERAEEQKEDFERSWEDWDTLKKIKKETHLD